jgi:PAS domain S-box-containing protein
MALESDGPVAFGPGFEKPVSTETARDFSVQSQMFMALYPRVGKPWLFGLHQCSHAQVWTEEEQRLFNEIGRRITDGLSTLLFLSDLQESEAKYRSLFQNTGTATFIAEEDMTISEVNAKCEELSGYSREEIVGKKKTTDFIAPEELERIKKYHFGRRKGIDEAPPEYEFNFVDRHGNVKPVMIQVGMIPGTKRSIASIIDITPLKRAERKLKFQNILLATQQETSLDGILVVDEDRKIISYNQRFWKMWGIPLEVLGTRQDKVVIQSVLHKLADPEQFLAGVDYLYEHPTEKNYEGLVLNDGRTFERYSTPMLAPEGAYLGRVWYFRDITKRKRAEAALEERLQFETLLAEFSATFVNLPASNVDREIEHWLQRVTEFLDADRSMWFEFNEDMTRARSVYAYAANGFPPPPSHLTQEQAPYYFEKLRRGEIFMFSGVDNLPDEAAAEKTFFIEEGVKANLTIPLQVSGVVLGALGFGTLRIERTWPDDLVQRLRLVVEIFANALERRRAEEALRQHTAELEARNEELDAFAHTVAHDLKNPVARIVGFADLLKEGPPTLSDEEIHNCLAAIVKNGFRMSAIIDELLLLSSVRKVEEVKTHPLDMASIVTEIQDRLAPMIEEYQAEVVLPETWPVALGYGPWVEEVWVNYLSNALKYGDQPPCVELGATVQADGMVRFWVRDNGPGISPEDQARLFTLFTRLDQVRAKGHGLGLSIVRRIVEELGGQVGVESEIGQGSVFSFSLPGVI